MNKIINKNSKVISILLLAFAFTACSDSFLEKNPTALISTDQKAINTKWNSSILFGDVNGTVSTSFTQGTGGTDDHDDFGQKSIDIATDLMCGDMVMGGETYGWFSDDSKLLNSTTTKTRAYKIWRYYYRLIKAANIVFDQLQGDSIIPSDDMQKVYFGQAKFLRAYAYFNLVNLYAKPYELSKNELALPIYRTQKKVESKPLSTVDKVYTFIINDLNTASECLKDYSRSTLDEPDTALVKAYKSYVYLSKGDYVNAASCSSDFIDSGAYPLLTKANLTTTGFNSISSSNWIWGVDLTKDNSPALATWWGMCDYFTYSYCWAGDYKMIPDNLLAKIPSTDGRKAWFRSKYPQFGYWKFYDNGRKAGGDKLWENDEVYMRVEEMYLINAEANVRAGLLDDAKTTLKKFMTERDLTVTANIDAMSSDQLLETIYYNWRVEMWGEGRGLITMKRFKKTVTRGTNDFSYPGDAFSYDDSRFTFEIPEQEINNNPYLR